jgi:DNA-binding NarL/FixJ family response regulator
LTGRVAHKLARNIRQHQPPVTEQPVLPKELDLSEREVEIAQMMVLGLNAREIADKTFLSLGTVKNYTSSIYSKIGINDRSKAMIALREMLKL